MIPPDDPATNATATLTDRSEENEFANTLTHAVGFLLSLAATAALVQAARPIGIGTLIAVAVYGASLMMVYAMSTLSHAVKNEATKETFRAWDQGSIYFLIVGTYTPFIAAYLAPAFAAVVASIIWTAALLGFYSKVVAKHRVHGVAMINYLLLGWLPALAFVGRAPLAIVGWLALGGASYSAGVIFLKFDYLHRYFHATWHVLVILASAIHFYAIYSIAIPSAS